MKNFDLRMLHTEYLFTEIYHLIYIKGGLFLIMIVKTAVAQRHNYD